LTRADDELRRASAGFVAVVPGRDDVRCRNGKRAATASRVRRSCYEEPMRTALLLIAIGCLAPACDGGKADDKAKTESKAKAESKAKVEAEAKTDAKVADAKVESKVAESKVAESKVAESKVDDAKVAPPSVAAPTDAEAAARQLGAWLDDPSKAPAPALLTATTEIEFVERCDSCDGEAKPKTTKVVGVDAVTKKVAELADTVASGEWVVEDEVKCKKGCCAFVFDPELGIGHNIVHLEQICMALDASGKPTGYTRIETSGTF
jgi:hypothetical protein